MAFHQGQILLSGDALCIEEVRVFRRIAGRVVKGIAGKETIPVKKFVIHTDDEIILIGGQENRGAVLTDAIAQGTRVWQGVKCQVWGHFVVNIDGFTGSIPVSDNPNPRQRIREIIHGGFTEPVTHRFKAAHEVSSSFTQWAAQGKSKLVALEGWRLEAVEEIPGIQLAVAQVFKEISVELIGAVS